MKHLITILSLFVLSQGFSQNDKANKNTSFETIKIENVTIEVNVDNVDDIETTFSLDDIKDLLNETQAGEEISFKIVCNGALMSNGEKSSMSFHIEGNTDNKEDFIQNVEKVRTAAINYYNNKN